MAQIIARDLHLDYPVYGVASRSFKRALLNLSSAGRIATNAREVVVVNALKGLSFDIQEGDRVGLIGANGSGKTTLLRVLAGIFQPTSGALKVDGFSVPLLDIGLGIQEDASGLENIALRAMLLGLNRKDIVEKTDEIIEFTELGDYIHLPVRTYSSGMRMRLAFAVSIFVQPEILLMDEWISVGDARFVAKAEDRLQKLVASTNILVLASHSLGMVEQVCNKAMVLDQGRSVFYGPVPDAMQFYSDMCASETPPAGDANAA